MKKFNKLLSNILLEYNINSLQTESDFNYNCDIIGAPPNPNGPIKQVRTRKYNRGLGAMSPQNRRLFNQKQLLKQQQLDNTNDDNNITPVKTVNKVKEKTVAQQPISTNQILPPPGVNRPVAAPIHNKQDFSHLVYKPSLTDLTKETAKRRCLKARKARKLTLEDSGIEFSPNWAGVQTSNTQAKPEVTTDRQIVNDQKGNIFQNKEQRKLCIICKEYVKPAEQIDDQGKVHYVCPKCGSTFVSNK